MTGGRARLKTIAGLLWHAHPWAVVALLGATFGMGALPISTTWLARTLINSIAAGRSDPGLYLLVAGIAAGLTVSRLMVGMQRYMQRQLGRCAEVVVTERLLAAVNAIPGLAELERPGFHDRLELAQRAGQVVPRQAVAVASTILQTAVSTIGFAGSLLVISPWAALLVTVAAVPQLAAELRLARRRAGLRLHLSPADRRRHFYTRLQSEPTAAKELRLFGLGTYFHGRMSVELRGIHRAERALDRRSLRIQSALELLGSTMMVIALGAAAREAVAGRLAPGDVVVLLAALPTLAMAVSGLVGQFGEGAEMLMLLTAFEEIVTLEHVADSGAPAPRLREAIVFEDVWFRYADDLPWVLRGVDLRIPVGNSLGLVGLNGAGKSTIVKLVGRLYEPTKGRILWDGVDLREFGHEALRQRIAMVFQDYMTYDLTAAENIGLGDLQRLDDLELIREAAQIADADATLARLPDGYATMLSKVHAHVDGADGVQLSGGQWQRVAVARMLMRRDRDLLVLDEPSAGLDAEAEVEIQRIVRRRTEGATRVLITHRLNTVRTADRIAVLEDGMITAEGTHEALMASGGRYAELFRLQASGYEMPTDAARADAG